MMLLAFSCVWSSAGALRLNASPALSAPDAEEGVRAKLMEAQRKFNEAAGADAAKSVSFLDVVSEGQAGGSAGIPVVDLSVSQGSGAWSGISAAIAEAESSREKVEGERVDADIVLFDNALKAAEGQIEEAARRIVTSLRTAASPSSFVNLGAHGVLHARSGPRVVEVASGSEPQIIEVNVPAATPLDEQAVVDALRSVEGKRAPAESEMFSGWTSDLEGLTAFVLHMMNVAPTRVAAEKGFAAVGGALERSRPRTRRSSPRIIAR